MISDYEINDEFITIEPIHLGKVKYENKYKILDGHATSSIKLVIS